MNSSSFVLMLWTFQINITFIFFHWKAKTAVPSSVHILCCTTRCKCWRNCHVGLFFFSFPSSTSNKGVCWSWINSREPNRFLHIALIVIVTSSIFSTIWMHIAPIWIYIPTTSPSVSPTVWKESIFPLSVYELHYDPAGFDCHGSSTSQIQRLLA